MTFFFYGAEMVQFWCKNFIYKIENFICRGVLDSYEGPEIER